MSQAPSMPVFTDALLGDTLHLSAEEFGAYCLLLFATWRNNGQALTEDKMARICRVTPQRWRERLQPVLIGFFTVDTEGKWHQKRLEKEWNYIEHLASEQSRKGKASALKRWGTVVTDPSSRLQPNGNPHTHTHKKEEDSEATPLPPDDPVKKIFARGLAMLGGERGALLGKMRQLHGDVAVLKAIVACEGERPSDPASYFVACLARAPPKNSHGNQSPVTTLYEGALRAADKLDREEADRRVGGAVVVPLLDCGRSR